MTPAKPRLLIAGRTRYDLPLDEGLERKFSALRERFVVRVLATAGRVRQENDVFHLVRPVRPSSIDGFAFHMMLPVRIARELRSFGPDAVLVQGAHEGAAALLARTLAGSNAPVILDIHGDWRAATRLYGSRARRLLSVVADGVAVTALRRADEVRTVSRFTSELVRELGIEPAAEFPAFMDVEPLLASAPAPIPRAPIALFVGVLERYKDVDGLAAAWRSVATRVPEAQLRIIGTGSRARTVRKLVADLPGRATWVARRTPEEIAEELDCTTCLVLPSPREGMGRVIVEAFCRGRAVIGARAGGIPELVVDGENGVLVSSMNAGALADALVRVLSGDEAERMGAAARSAAERLAVAPDEYAAALSTIVLAAIERRRGMVGAQRAPRRLPA